ncbi:hypothetical protein ACFE04_031729 [Oxalis oulophora]
MEKISGTSTFRQHEDERDDDEALMWAAIERLRLPTLNGKGLLKDVALASQLNEIDHDVVELDPCSLKVTQVDNLLSSLRRRLDRVGIEIPTIEVRYENLRVEAEKYHVGSRSALPSFTNFSIDMFEDRNFKKFAIFAIATCKPPIANRLDTQWRGFAANFETTILKSKEEEEAIEHSSRGQWNYQAIQLISIEEQQFNVITEYVLKFHPATNSTLGVAVMKSRSLYPYAYWYWIGIGALIGFIILFNALFTLFLTVLNAHDKKRAVILESESKEIDSISAGAVELSSSQGTIKIFFFLEL